MGRKDAWITVHREVVKKYLMGVPGWQSTKKKDLFLIHQSHQPLLGDVSLINPPKTHQFVSDVLTLRPYQEISREFIRTRYGTLLADQQRLGKTPTCVASHEMSEGRIIVAGPLQARHVWMGWFAKRWPNAKRLAVIGRDAAMNQVKAADCIFMHYDVLAAWQFIGINVGTFILDEAHVLSNRKSKRTQAAFVLAGESNRVVAVTGTPIWNKPNGMYSILQLVSPGAWGSYYQFAERYCAGTEGAFGFSATGSSNEEEFQKRLSTLMIRRTWADVLDEVPKMSRSVSLVELSPQDKLIIDKELAIANDVKAGFNTVAGDMARLRRVVGSYKIKQTVIEAKRILAEGNPVVVWVYHKDVARKIARALGTSPITGETAVGQREHVLAEWRNATKALVISLGVGQTAIDLSHAKHAIFSEIDYTPAVLAQAEMRTFNGAQPVSSIYVVTDHLIEASLVRVLMSKMALANKLGISAAEVPIDMIGEALQVFDESNLSSGDLLSGLFTDVYGED